MTLLELIVRVFAVIGVIYVLIIIFQRIEFFIKYRKTHKK